MNLFMKCVIAYMKNILEYALKYLTFSSFKFEYNIIRMLAILDRKFFKILYEEAKIFILYHVTYNWQKCLEYTSTMV